MPRRHGGGLRQTGPRTDADGGSISICPPATLPRHIFGFLYRHIASGLTMNLLKLARLSVNTI